VPLHNLQGHRSLAKIPGLTASSLVSALTLPVSAALFLPTPVLGSWLTALLLTAWLLLPALRGMLLLGSRLLPLLVRRTSLLGSGLHRCRSLRVLAALRCLLVLAARIPLLLRRYLLAFLALRRCMLWFLALLASHLWLFLPSPLSRRRPFLLDTA